MVVMHETLIYAVYYAPRGRLRLYRLGRDIAERHLFPTDLLVGVVGAEGAGKSTLIHGIFPGLELTNDDEGINLRSAPIFDFNEADRFGPHTYHIDVRYEQAFHQLWEIAEAVSNAIRHRRRVIVEHFDLLYPHLNFNAQIILGIGEELSARSDERPNVASERLDERSSSALIEASTGLSDLLDAIAAEAGDPVIANQNQQPRCPDLPEEDRPDLAEPYGLTLLWDSGLHPADVAALCSEHTELAGN